MRASPSNAEFEAMFRTTSPRVFAYIRRHVDADAAPDLVSEVYMTAWRRRSDIPSEPLPWLLVTARNMVRRHWASRSKAAQESASAEGVETLAAASDATPEDRIALANAFAQLSHDDREVLLLVGWDGLTPQQAARVLGCTPNTFAARLSRARRRFTQLTDAEPPHRHLALTTASGENHA